MFFAHFVSAGLTMVAFDFMGMILDLNTEKKEESAFKWLCKL